MPAASPIIQARIQYLASANEDNTAIYYASQAGVTQARDHEGQFEYVLVDVTDARQQDQEEECTTTTTITPMIPQWNIDRHGYQLVSQQTAVTDFWNDEDQIPNIYYSEIRALLLRSVPQCSSCTYF